MGTVARPLRLKLLEPGRRPMLTLAVEFCCVAVTVPSSVPSSSWPFRYTCNVRRRSVVDAGDEVPGVGLQRGRPVAEHLPPELLVSLNPIVRGPRSTVVSSWIADLGARSLGDDRCIVEGTPRVDPRADGHAPVSCSAAGLPSSTKSLTPSSSPHRVAARPPGRPVRQRAGEPVARASAAVVPDPSLKA